MDIAFYSDLFEQLWEAGKYEEAVKLYEDKEAQQLLEVLMNNRPVNMEKCLVEKRLEELAQCPDIVPLRGERIMPDALSLVSHAETRVGLWWYRVETRAMAFSGEARTHFQLDNFPIVKDFHGWVRGAVFQKGGSNYVLIYKCDFPNGIIHGETFGDMCHLVETMSRSRVSGIVDEEGRDLLGKEREGQQ